jgi:anti-anti-sigma factor
MCPAFSFSVVDVGDVHIVSLRGELDMATAVGLEDWLVEVSGSTVVVDLDQLTFMDSSGIAALIGARNRMIEKGDALVLTRPKENVRRVFGITGLTDWFSDWDPNWLEPEKPTVLDRSS